MTGYILVDHGSRKKEANQLVVQLAETMQIEHPGAVITGAHMELARPDIPDAVETCLKKGADEIVVMPYMLTPGKHAMEDIPAIVKTLSVQYVGQARFRVLPPLQPNKAMRQYLAVTLGLN